MMNKYQKWLEVYVQNVDRQNAYQQNLHLW